VPKKRKPGQRKLNADTNDQESALAALAGMGIADAILPAVSIPVETSNAVLEALDSKLSWATAREEGVKANEFWTAETARVRDENRNVFLNLDDAKRACAIHLMVVATGGDAPAEALICFVGCGRTPMFRRRSNDCVKGSGSRNRTRLGLELFRANCFAASAERDDMQNEI
jgi:hypothetical protein